MWKKFFVDEKVEIRDIVDKKLVALYGRSFKKLNVRGGKVVFEIIDPIDILVDRFVDPVDLDTSNFVIHTHIYRTLGEIERNPNYDKEAIKRLKDYYSSRLGIIKAKENIKLLSDKLDKLRDLGVVDTEFPPVGNVIVEINEYYKKLWNDKTEREEIYLIVRAENEILMVKPLNEVIGKTVDDYWATHYPFSTWADDIERTDFWSDGLADIARPICKIVNSFFSQMVENRVLKNFGMYFYDATNPNFVPQVFEPRPFGWYPVPGDPNKVIRRFAVPDLSDNLNEIVFLTQVLERATGVTAIQKGVSEKKEITLGEVQLLYKEAQERAIASSKFYQNSWKDFGYRWYKMLEAQADNLDDVELYKKSFTKGVVYGKKVKIKDLISSKGYNCKVLSSAEQERSELETINKFNAVLQIMADNEPLKLVFQRKLLDLLDLNPDEKKDILEFEKQRNNLLKFSGLQIEQPQLSLPEELNLEELK